MRKSILLSVSGTFLFVVLFIFTEEFAQGIRTGLANCARVVIPSLFPFMAAASLTGSGEIPEKLKKLINPLTEFLFRLPAECFFAVIIGQLGGYLSGAKAAEILYQSGRLSESQASRLMLFCVNAGMGFAVNAVGSVMLNSRESGRILLLSLIISSLVIGFFSKFIPDSESKEIKLISTQSSASQAIVTSVTSSALSTVNACAFVIAFSGIAAITESHINNENVKMIVSCLLEVTNGCFLTAGKISLPTVAAICAFGGLCVHLQVFSVAKSIKIKIPLFYAFRILHSASAYAICKILLHFFPIEQSVFLTVSKNAALWSFSAPASVSLLFLSALLILDLDNKREIC